MIWTLFFLLASTAAARDTQSGQSQPISSQTYRIFINGEFAGTEQVEEAIDRNGNPVISSRHELLVAGAPEVKRVAFETTLTLTKGGLVPTDYRIQYTSGQAGDYCEVKVREGQIHRLLSRGGRVSESAQPMSPDTVVFDFNVYYQYDHVVQRYDLKRKGRQLFKDFVPVIGSEIPLALTYIGDGELDFGQGRLSVRNFRIELVGVMNGSLSVDKNNRLVRLVVRDKGLEVLRQDVLIHQDAPPAAVKPPV